MAKKENPPIPPGKKKPRGSLDIRSAIDIKVPKRGAKGDELRKKIRHAIGQALKQIPLDVLESSETIVIRTNSMENGNG